jgi:hypothetical protein
VRFEDEFPPFYRLKDHPSHLPNIQPGNTVTDHDIPLFPEAAQTEFRHACFLLANQNLATDK